ncbi:LOW QUALITY PROTEIN: glutamate racemase [Geomicrobium sp. JCM 19037]|nr:LOW QUALITY PROTEIN: glutamate racemase [Geomicrobium sp. JCM 19037]
MNLPIGVIDSGVGGLTVAKEIARQLPKEQMIYIGDTDRCPYGSRPYEEVRRFTWQMIERLLQKKIKMLVIACNTATAVILEEARQKLSIPVVGVIHPGAIAALNHTVSKRVAVIGTEGTISSGAYPEAIQAFKEAKLRVTSLACPPFVPLVEQNRTSFSEAYNVVKETLKPLESVDFDTLILGCTHYPLLKEVIQSAVGEHVKVISSGAETAREVSMILQHDRLSTTSEEEQENLYYTSGSVHAFRKTVSTWLEDSSVNISPISFASSAMNQ